jgi:hypothetical protein
MLVEQMLVEQIQLVGSVEGPDGLGQATQKSGALTQDRHTTFGGRFHRYGRHQVWCKGDQEQQILIW